MFVAFCAPHPLRLRQTRVTSTRACASADSSDARAPRKRARVARRAAAACAAAVLAGTAFAGYLPPQPVEAMGLAPTPINPYAKRRAAKAYEEYVHRLEERMEVLPLGDLRQVVSYGGGGPSVKYRIAGFAAFVASSLSVLVVHPIDSVKTRLQAGAPGSSLFADLYRGVLGNLLKEAPNAAIYLGVYELIKTALMQSSFTPLFRDLPLLTFMLAGALGDAVGSVVRVPAEVVNKRLQLGLSQSFVTALKDIFSSPAGRSSLATAWASVLLRDVPFGGLQIMLYELGKSALVTHASELPTWLPASGLGAHIVVGSLAGAFTALVTTPADVLVTRIALASDDRAIAARAGVFDHLRALLRKQGIPALFTGSWQRAAYYLVMSALFFGLYELTSHYASNPSQIIAAVHSLQVSTSAHVAPIVESLAHGAERTGSNSLSATLYLLMEQLPFLMSILSLHP